MRKAWALGAIALASCGSPPQLSVENAWVRLPAVAGRPGAAYFTVHGGPAPATLISVGTDVAIRTEMHESMADGMRPLGAVPIPAAADTIFAPGGRHVMLYDINPGIKPGGTLVLTLTFSDGTRLTRKAQVRSAADAGG